MSVTKDGAWVNDPVDAPGFALASAARAAGSSTSSAIDVGDAAVVIGRLNITNANGGTLNPMSLQGTIDGTNWDTIDSWPSKAANGSHTKRFSVRGYSQVRWSWTVATATMTFAVDQTTKLGDR